MLIGYLVFVTLVILIPKLVRALLSDLPGASRLSEVAVYIIAGLLAVLLVSFGTRLWVEAAVVLVRPLYTWQGVRVDPMAVMPLQEHGVWIIRVAVLATIARFALIAKVWHDPTASERVQVTQRALAEPSHDGSPVSPWSDTIPAIARAVIAAGVVTLMLSGLIEAWLVGVLLFCEFLILRLLAAGIIPPRMDAWRRFTTKIPTLARLAFALLLLEILRDLFASEQDETFTRLAIFVGVSVVVMYLLVPGQPRFAESTEAATP